MIAHSLPSTIFINNRTDGDDDNFEGQDSLVKMYSHVGVGIGDPATFGVYKLTAVVRCVSVESARIIESMPVPTPLAPKRRKAVKR